LLCAIFPEGFVMRLRVRTDRWTTMFFAALGLTPLAACGGATTLNVNGSAGAGGSDGTTSGAGGSVGSGSSTTGITVGSSTTTIGVTVGTTTGTGVGGAGGMAFPCYDPVPVVNPKSGYEACANGSMHRPFKSYCPTTVPRPYVVAPDAGYNGCARDSDCPGPYGYCTSGGQLAGYYCSRGCVQDSDCMPSQICVCGDPIGMCVAATCSVDADCGPGLMCASHAPFPGCSTKYFGCQTPYDLCGGDHDCPISARCSIQNGRRACTPANCAEGRPFLIGFEARVANVAARGDWTAKEDGPDVSRLTAAERGALASAWTAVALAEHASIAAFARFTLHLLRLGAPASLVERSNAAMADETHHAKLAFAIASRYAGREIGPGALDIDGALEQSSLRDILVTTIREGCIGETVAAIEASEAFEHAEDPCIRRALERIAADETRHAELAWQFVRWALDHGGDEVRRICEAEFERATDRAPGGRCDADTCEDVLLAAGIVPERIHRMVYADTVNDVVRVCARRLLSRFSHGARAA
jgi:hypothetical protein